VTRKLLLLALALGIVCAGSACGRNPTDLPKAAKPLPNDLTHEIETVAANSWKAVPIQIPYKCSLTISAHVERGNSMTMMLTNSKGIERLTTHKSGSYLGEFYVPNTTTFQHTGRVNQGTYYFVIRDKHIGKFSSSSDVSVKASIQP
jgi:hypothetical protein